MTALPQLLFRSVDNQRGTHRVFQTIEDARKAAVDAVGETPDIGSHYAVSEDGISTVEAWAGCTLADLFPEAFR